MQLLLCLSLRLLAVLVGVFAVFLSLRILISVSCVGWLVGCADIATLVMLSVVFPPPSPQKKEVSDLCLACGQELQLSFPKRVASWRTSAQNLRKHRPAKVC